MNITAKADGMAHRAAAMGKAEATLKERARTLFKARIQALKQDAVSELADVTPVLTGKLRASTTADVRFSGDSSATIEVRQPATNEAGQEYMIFVVLPGVTRNYPGNPYPTVAEAKLRPAAQRVMRAVGEDAMVAVRAVLKAG
jgi:hypothetical protein